MFEGKHLVRTLQKGNSLAALVIHGEGTWTSIDAHTPLSVRAGDLAIIEAAVDSELILRAEGATPLRTAIVEVPVSVPYRLYA